VSLVSAKGLAWAPLVLALLYPAICPYDLSRSTLWYYDFLSMNPNVIWFTLLLAILVALAAWSNGDIPLPSLFAVILVFSGMEVLTNYPAIFSVDVYLHGSAVRGIIALGRIGNTYDVYPQNNPGVFLLWSALTMITGADVRFTNVVLLLPACAALMMLLVFIFFRQLRVSLPGSATLLTILLLNYGDNEQSLLLFNTKIYSLILILAIFLVFFVRDRGTDQRSGLVTLLLLYPALVIMHPLNSLIVGVFVVLYGIMKMERTRHAVGVFLLCAAIYCAWNSFVAVTWFGEGLYAFVHEMNFALTLDLANRWVPTATSGEPLFGVILTTYYKALLCALGLCLAYCVLRFRKDRRVRVLTANFVAVASVYALLFFVATSFTAGGPWTSVNRGIWLGSFSLAGGAVVALLPRSISRRSRRTLAFVMIVALLIFPHVVLVHRDSLAMEGNVQPRDNASVFIYDHRNGQHIVTTGDFNYYYSFYDPFFRGYTILGLGIMYPPPVETNSLGGILHFLTAQERGSIVVIDSKDVEVWAISGHAHSYSESSTAWNNNVFTKIDLQLNRIYCNGLQRLYQ
jgi:hypothetical protein